MNDEYLKKFPWAANHSKLKRAIERLGNADDEEALKAEYERIGGLIVKKAKKPTITSDGFEKHGGRPIA